MAWSCAKNKSVAPGHQFSYIRVVSPEAPEKYVLAGEINFCRVQCFGEATIIEVSNRTKKIYVKHEAANLQETRSEMHDVKIKKIELEKQIVQIKERISLLEKEKYFITTYGDRLRPSDKVYIPVQLTSFS